MTSVLVTGHKGFIGSHIYDNLKQLRYDVQGIDVKEGNDCRDWFRKSDDPYDIVIHCAAKVGGRRIMDWTPMAHAENLEIDAGLFQWAYRMAGNGHKPERIVYFSSSCAYPVLRYSYVHSKLKEEDINFKYPAYPDKLYGWAKLTGELLATQAHEDGIDMTVVRPFSVYGPRANPGFAVTGFVAQAEVQASPFRIWGNAAQERDYIHVQDIANAVIQLIWDEVDGPVNLGTGKGTTIMDLARMVTKAAGYSPVYDVDKNMPAGVPHLVADPSRMLEHYKPQFDLESYINGLFS